MKYALDYYELDEAMLDKGTYIRFFSNKWLEPYFVTKDYGNDVKDICIYIQLIRVEKRYEHLFKLHKPKFIDHKVLYNSINNLRWEWNKRFQIEIRFNNETYNAFLVANDEESNKILARETLAALDQLDKIPKRLKDFDKNAFIFDVKSLYESNGWL